MPSQQARLQQELKMEMERHAKLAGLFLDKYDADFYLGVIMGWLREKDAALTSSGVRRFRR